MLAPGVFEAAAALAHLVLAAIWLGAMSYSLAVVQPRAARLLGTEGYEEFAAVIAHGARWSVLALCAGLVLTGLAVVALATAGAGDATPGIGWWTLVLAKIVLLVAALAVFWRVSWRLWPRRVFALSAELPAVLRSFRVAAWTLLVLVAAQFVLGAAAGAVR